MSCIPDALVASLAWHLIPALGGVRVQVPEGELARARAAVDEPELDDEESPPPPAQDEPTRALRAAVLGLNLWPLLHPYALALSAIYRQA